MVDETSGQYGLVLPDDLTLTSRFAHLVKYWAPRNRFILDMRAAQAGENEIEAPTSAQYKVHVLHAYQLATIISQKLSRYLHLPTIYGIPLDSIDPKARTRATEIETALNVALEQIEQRTTGDVWGRVLNDQHLLHGGVEKWVRAPNVYWTELVCYEESAKRKAEDKTYELEFPYLGDKKERKEYLKEKGIPITRYYVPLENWYPQYDANMLIESFETDERTLTSVRNNPLFDKNEYNADAWSQLNTVSSRDGGISELVTIVEYVNLNWHAYYLAGKSTRHGRNWPRVYPQSTGFLGNLRLLYKYEHNLGVSLYNLVDGPIGSWKTVNTRIEGMGKGLLELNQACDDLLSQEHTYIRATKWPTMKATLDPEKRGFGTDMSKAKAPRVNEGEEVILMTGEDMVPFFEPRDDPQAQWHWKVITDQLAKMGGAPALFGDRQPGVESGYEQALQKTSAEDVDSKFEQHASVGAVQGAKLFMLHMRCLGEDIDLLYEVTDPEDKKKKRKVSRQITFKQGWLDPLPRLDAQVRKPSPMDFLTNLRAFQMATQSVNGMPPAMSYDTARSEILAMSAPDEEKFKILIESQENEIIANGVLSAKIGDLVNVKLAKHGVPQVSPEMMSKADPALVNAIQQGAQQGAPGAQPQMGGTSPAMLTAAAQTAGIPQSVPGGGGGQPPGPLPGNPEGMNRLGEAMQMNQQTGASL